MKPLVKETFYIRASVPSVFAALSDSRELTKWLLKTAKLDPRKGGKYKFAWIGGYEDEGRVLEFNKNKKLVLDWAGSGNRSKVTFTTKKAGNTTMLTLIQSGFPSTTEGNLRSKQTAVGWTYYVMNLKSLLENKKDLRHKYDDLFSGWA
jgi:uncharacterized protein YndB with AHSA1/START domain